MGWDYYGYKPYVSVAQRRAQAAKELANRAKKGLKVSPVVIEGRNIASTFWGKAWCVNLEGYSDYANRIPRGRTYVRNGSVVHLEIKKGRIEAVVSGSELYEITIDIAALSKDHWRALKTKCAGQIGSLVELLQGKLSKAVMETVTDRNDGLFPKPKEIKMRCSCPDSAGMCKHLAAVMYGVGNRLDKSPELLFLLRGVDHLELIEQAIPSNPVKSGGKSPAIANDDLGAIFGIEIEETPAAKKPAKHSAAAKPPAKVTKTAAQKKPSPQKMTATATAASTAKAPKKVAAKPAAAPAPAPAPKKSASVKKGATTSASTAKTATKVVAKPAPKETATVKKAAGPKKKGAKPSAKKG